jgi:hypothetical protein
MSDIGMDMDMENDDCFEQDSDDVFGSGCEEEFDLDPEEYGHEYFDDGSTSEDISVYNEADFIYPEHDDAVYSSASCSLIQQEPFRCASV